MGLVPSRSASMRDSIIRSLTSHLGLSTMDQDPSTVEGFGSDPRLQIPLVSLTLGEQMLVGMDVKGNAIDYRLVGRYLLTPVLCGYRPFAAGFYLITGIHSLTKAVSG
ncbi:hypothetical protein J6590_013899 [Homalodisca vitripennis]|nr:hypothetical protein J6590_013899 [Homalodisca vitripennis]